MFCRRKTKEKHNNSVSNYQKYVFKKYLKIRLRKQCLKNKKNGFWKNPDFGQILSNNLLKIGQIPKWNLLNFGQILLKQKMKKKRYGTY